MLAVRPTGSSASVGSATECCQLPSHRGATGGTEPPGAGRPGGTHLNRLPAKVRDAALAAVVGRISENPRRLGKALVGELAGLSSTRRGDYRIVYGIDEALAVGGRPSDPASGGHLPAALSAGISANNQAVPALVGHALARQTAASELGRPRDCRLLVAFGS